MAYSATVTAVTNGTLSAAQWNSGVRDNFSTLWVYTTAGDLAYATSSTGLTRLAIGSEYKSLRVNSGATAPAWEADQFSMVYHSTTQSASSGVSTTLAFNSESSDVPGWHSTVSNTSRITVTKTGYYMASVYINYSTSGGSGTYMDTVALLLNGVAVMYDRRYSDIDAFAKLFSITFPVYPLTASNYLEVALTQSSGLTATVAANAYFSVWRVA